MEECSVSGIFWTFTPYASHYVFISIEIYIVEVLQKQSNLGLIPFMNVINNMSNDEKNKEITDN